jgi:hypothetical protein
MRFAALVPSLATVVALGALPAAAQVFESVGTRALGMGGAFVAVADDGTATYWNPAGLAAGAVLDFCAGQMEGDSLAVPAGSGASGEASGRSFCLAMPAIGLSYHRLRVTTAVPLAGSTGDTPGDRQDLRPREVGVSSLVATQLGVTLVQTLAPGLVLGTTIKAVRARFATAQRPPGTGPAAALEQGRELVGRRETVVDADVGLMAVAGHVRLGLTARNLREPGFESSSGAETTLARQLRVGVAITPRGHAAAYATDPQGLIVAADLDLTRTATPVGDRRNVAVGIERWWAGRRVGVRAGARASVVDRARPVATAGASVGIVRGVFVEAAVTRGHRDGDRGWAIGMRAGF